MLVEHELRPAQRSQQCLRSEGDNARGAGQTGRMPPHGNRMVHRQRGVDRSRHNADAAKAIAESGRNEHYFMRSTGQCGYALPSVEWGYVRMIADPLRHQRAGESAASVTAFVDDV